MDLFEPTESEQNQARLWWQFLGIAKSAYQLLGAIQCEWREFGLFFFIKKIKFLQFKIDF